MRRVCLTFSANSTYENAVVNNANVPDPGVLYVQDEHVYYAATTSNEESAEDRYPIRVSKVR